MSEIEGLKRRLKKLGCETAYADGAGRVLRTAFRGDSNPTDEQVAGEINKALDEIERGDAELVEDVDDILDELTAEAQEMGLY